MPNWKKLITSGSNAHLNQVTASSFTGSFTGDGSGLTGVGSSITVKDEGTNLTTTLSSLDFVGSGVSASLSSGDAVTVTITGADLAAVFEQDSNGDLQPTNDANGLSVFYNYDANGDIQPSA